MTISKIDPISGLVLDMDGVLWRGSEPLGDLPALFDRIRRKNWRFVLATNNATRSVDQYLEKLRAFGVTLEPWQIINSALATAQYLSRRHPEGGNVYVVGEDGLVQTLQQFGFHDAAEDAIAVVVGMDRGFNYEKLKWATRLIRKGVPFLGTNPDRTFPDPGGLVPGAGSLLAAIQAASDVEPVIIGKPSPEMFRQAIERLRTEAAQTLVVGDRLETDIAGGKALGCRTALLLSGVSSGEDLENGLYIPDLVARDLTALLDELI